MTEVVSSCRQALLDARSERRCALIPYLTLGFPTLPASLAVLAAIESMGADVVEIGIPFSDPVADGPTIQRTIDVALRQGVTLRSALTAVAEGSDPGGARLLFSYLNPLLAYGLESLPAALAAAHTKGVLITDLIVDEASEWLDIARSNGVETCFLVAATSDDTRIDRAAESSSGFVYCISTLGVTGARKGVDPAARRTVERLRTRHEVPVAVGFGISRPEDVRQVAAYADGVVVGSALMSALGNATEPADAAARAVEFLQPLLDAARA